MPAPFRTRGATVVLVFLAAALPTCISARLDLSDGSSLEVDRELPGPILVNGTPTKLYSLSLGRVRHDHKARADLDAMKLAKREHGRRLHMSFEDTPLFLGKGTHFAYLYVGTPPQRASVIVSTGSHFTAFPCSGCRLCGNHTDPYWKPDASSTADIVTCDDHERCHGSYRCQKDKRCVLTERYVEMSSWRAQQVEDQIWVGEMTLADSKNLQRDESAFSVDFMFGCIESLTGLFKTQLADGIMGMNADSRTLISQLAKAGKIKERTFSLCFSETGGTMVIGGYDPRLNKPGSEMQYTTSDQEILAPRVKVTGITLNGVSIAADASVFQRGKGMWVSSGQTDTYLPRAVADGFSDAWEAATGSPYSTCKTNQFCMTVTTADMEALPVLTIHMDGGVEVNVRPEAYLEASPYQENAFAPRIYLTESSGGVLGANVMRDHNIVFDYDNHLVGFADGACDYHAHSKGPVGGNAGAEDGPAVEVDAEANVDCVTATKRMKQCDAECPAGQSQLNTVEGHEIWEHVIITHPQGSGKACPEKIAEERRGCVKDCP